jgi:hypothetical protein
MCQKQDKLWGIRFEVYWLLGGAFGLVAAPFLFILAVPWRTPWQTINASLMMGVGICWLLSVVLIFLAAIAYLRE